MISRSWAGLLLLILLFASAVARGGEVQTPPPGSKERAAIMDAVRAAAMPELKRPVKFFVHKLNILEDWAFLVATPQQPDGRPFDYSGTIYEQQIRDGAFDDSLDALLRLRNGRWQVIALVIGATDVAWEPWSEEYNAPPAIFR